MESIQLAEERLQSLLDDFNAEYGTELSVSCVQKMVDRMLTRKGHTFLKGVTYKLTGPLVKFKARLRGRMTWDSDRVLCFIDRLLARYPEEDHFRLLVNLVKDGLAINTFEHKIDQYSQIVLYSRTIEVDWRGTKHTAYRVVDVNGTIYSARTTDPTYIDTVMRKEAVDINSITL